MRIRLLLLLLLSMITTASFATHSTDYTWMGYCCGKRDCKQAVVSIVEFRKDSSVVLVNNIMLELPVTSVRVSEDNHTYWCGFVDNDKVTKENTRCVFYSIGS